jgi:hypothetical protein
VDGNNDDDNDDDEDNGNFRVSNFTIYCSTLCTSPVACCNKPKALITSDILTTNICQNRIIRRLNGNIVM